MDAGQRQVDKQLKVMERKINKVYSQASKEVQAKLDDYMRRFKTKDEIKRKALKQGKITEAEYKQWRLGQVMIGKRWEEMQTVLATDLTNANRVAASIVNDHTPNAYAIGRNYGAYQVDLLTKGMDFKPTPSTVEGYGLSSKDGSMKTVRLYHGSFAEFDKFNFDAGKAFKAGGADMYGEGFYFTSVKEQARLYGDYIYYVDIQYSTDRRTAKKTGRTKDFMYNPKTGYWIIPPDKADNIKIVGVENLNTGEIKWKVPAQRASVSISFTLYDKPTVERLMKKNQKLLPKARVDIPKDLRWNKQKLNSAITQGVLQGEDIGKVSRRLQSITDMNKSSAIRNARTMMTSAENGGRFDSYMNAEGMGIEMEKQWLATLDGRTRHSHAAQDGEHVPVKEEFTNGLMFPADPDGDPREVYNCRCTMVAVLADTDPTVNPSEVYRNSRLGDMDYEDWLEEHMEEM